MPKKKTATTRTLNPLHFEDLDPHRFEDLVRRLLYGFRDWSEIEPTGRSGSDEGFDVRAFERQEIITNVDDEGEEGSRSGTGRIWQVQAKREKVITPAKMRAFIQEGIDEKNPPHGYIMAAATNVSKAAYDLFRSEVKKKGVRECHFWGKDYLEDQLSLSQNDEILFTFFGISLSPRRKTRTAEIKFAINNKNKIIKLALGGELHNGGVVGTGRAFLLRDIGDSEYPFTEQYAEFNRSPRWEECDAVQVGARGIHFLARERYAYYDSTRKEWDYTKAADVKPRRHNFNEPKDERREEDAIRVETFWRHLPRRVQAKLRVFGFVPYDEILIIDDRGDPGYPCPHLFVDFGDKGPFRHTFVNLVRGHEMIGEDKIDEFTQLKVFPERFLLPPKKRDVYKWETLGLSEKVPTALRALYSFDGKLDALKEGDVIGRTKTQDRFEEHQEITHVYDSTVAAVVEEAGSDYIKTHMTEFAGREIRDDDKIKVYETCRVFLPHEGQGYLRYFDDVH